MRITVENARAHTLLYLYICAEKSALIYIYIYIYIFVICNL